jgi:SAM-dependent methyltransferase
VKTWSTPVTNEKASAVPCCYCGGSIFKPALNCEGFRYVRCKTCSLVQINPQPDKDEVVARYSSKHGNDYLAYELENEAAFLKLQELALKDAGFFKLEKSLMRDTNATRVSSAEKDLSVLDIGCATGALLARLRERGWRVTGVEISPCAEYARKKRALEIKSVPLEECNFPDKSFDIVFASHLIEHLNDPHLFLNKVYRVLKTGGYFYITTPNISSFQACLFRSRWRSAIFDHLYLFSFKTLTAMLKKSGFTPEKISTWGGLASGLAPMWVKKPLDFLAKRLGFGDVMIIRARKWEWGMGSRE